jgi:hypothetical protein
MFVQLGLQLISDMSMRICSEVSVAENPMLCVRGFIIIKWFYFLLKAGNIYLLINSSDGD